MTERCPRCAPRPGWLFWDDGWTCLQCGYRPRPTDPLPLLRDDSARLPRDGTLRGSKVPKSWHPAPAVRAAQRRRKQGL